MLKLALAWALWVPTGFAQEAPDALIQRISEEVLVTLRQDKAIQAGNVAKVREVVEARILPHFDARRATQIALGANWRRATPEQQARLVREFTTLLVRTYSTALASYRDQSIDYLPLRGAHADDAEVTVRSRVRQSGAESVMIEYDVARTGAGWKVFDIRVSGISLSHLFVVRASARISSRQGNTG